MEVWLLLSPIILVSLFLVIKIAKSPEFAQITEKTKKASARVFNGAVLHFSKKQSKSKQISSYIPLIIIISIVSLLIMNPDIAVVLPFLPLGLAFFAKKVADVYPVLILTSIVSYGIFLFLIISLFVVREKNRFIRTLLLLIAFIILNFAGCHSNGPFIDG